MTKAERIRYHADLIAAGKTSYIFGIVYEDVLRLLHEPREPGLVFDYEVRGADMRTKAERLVTLALAYTLATEQSSQGDGQ